MEGSEYVPSEEVVANFLNVSEEELGAFTHRLAGVRGHLRIWVHPLYTEQWPGSAHGRLGGANLSDVQNKLRETFLRTASSVASNVNSSPLVVYEMAHKLGGTRDLVASRLGADTGGLTKAGILFVPTDRGTSQLDQPHLINALRHGNDRDNALAIKLQEYKQVGDDFVQMSRKHTEEIHTQFPQLAGDMFASLSEQERMSYVRLTARQWESIQPLMNASSEAHEKSDALSDEFMIALYRKIGLASALVSGAYLEVGKNSETKELELQACAGSLVKKLRDSGIPTDISNNIWPPKDLIKAAGFEVKQTVRDPEL